MLHETDDPIDIFELRSGSRKNNRFVRQYYPFEQRPIIERTARDLDDIEILRLDNVH